MYMEPDTGCGSHVLVTFGTGCGSSLEKNTPFIKVISINHKPIYILNCYYRGRRGRDLMQSVPITTYFVGSNTAHGLLDIILGDIVCQFNVK